jgi:predicted RNA-binding Zn ribbon-like protein
MVDQETTGPAPARKFQFIGGALCLDFCNTMGGNRRGIPHEFLEQYTDLVSWTQQAGLINSQQADSLARRSARHPDEARAVLGRGIALREAVYRIFFEVGQKKLPAPADMECLNRELGLTLHGWRVRETHDGFLWAWSGDAESLEYPLGPIARSAADLLTSRGYQANIHCCEGQNCGWMFVDASKNHSRRWCDMRDCGNRAKIKRHRQRQAKAKPRKA